AIRGDHFNLYGERHLGSGTALDAAFQATLGGIPLTDVRWVDNQTLEAVVPAGLAGEGLDLVVDGPPAHGARPLGSGPRACSPTRGPATFAATAEGLDGFTADTVKAQGSTGSAILAPAALRAKVHPLPATVTVGQQFTLAVDATNDGDADADAVTMADPQIAG